MAVLSPAGDVNIVSPIGTFMLNTLHSNKIHFLFLLIKTFLGLVEMTFGLVDTSYSLPQRQAVKLTFFALCIPVVVKLIDSNRVFALPLSS